MKISLLNRELELRPNMFMYILLIFIPITIILELTHSSPSTIFIVSCLSIIPLAGLMGEATEHLSTHLGAGIGGFLNATLGNTAELIICIVALRAGLFEIVKASLTGSIIGNTLLVMGLSLLVGGLKYKTQYFNATAAMTSSNMMAFSLIPLLIPAVMSFMLHKELEIHKMQSLSLVLACVLIGIYIFSLIFSLKTHKFLYDGKNEENEEDKSKLNHNKDEEEHKAWSIKTSVTILIITTIFIAIISEFLVGAVQETAHHLGWSELFIGVIILAIVGNAAEHFTAVIMASKNKMNLALNIVFGSSMQIALFVVPVLVFISFAMGKPMTLHFNILEIVAIGISIFFSMTI